MNREKLVLSISSIRHFINNSLALERDRHDVTGFELTEPLIGSATYNTYHETLDGPADTLHLRIKQSITEMTTFSYLETIKRLSQKFEWKNKEFMLAFDYTDEDFYGDVQGLDIHGWNKSSAVSGKFKFLAYSIVSDVIPQKIPLISLPIQLGHYKSNVISRCLTLVKPYIGEVKLLLFDRGFYDKDLMYCLIQQKLPFLIFVPKHDDKKEILYPMEEGEQFTVLWDSELKKHKTKYSFEFYLTFMKQIYCKIVGTKFDWVFATNIDSIALEDMIRTYRKRWRIETSFRVQDEARIKCKSKEMKIRYFCFMFQQLLHTQWVCFYKDEVPFKKFILELHETCKTVVANPKKSHSKGAKAKVK